jgi:hypothetical protein
MSFKNSNLTKIFVVLSSILKNATYFKSSRTARRCSLRASNISWSLSLVFPVISGWSRGKSARSIRKVNDCLPVCPEQLKKDPLKKPVAINQKSKSMAKSED